MTGDTLTFSDKGPQATNPAIAGEIPLGEQSGRLDTSSLAELGSAAVQLDELNSDPKHHLQELTLVDADVDPEQRTIGGYREVRGAWGGVLYGIHKPADGDKTTFEKIMSTHPDAKFLPIGEQSYRVYVPRDRET